MKLIIDAYLNVGDLENERIAFKVKENCNTKFFVAHLTNKIESGFFNKPKETFWLLPQEVKAGDWVVLYTKKGQISSKVNENGNTTYFFYWGLNYSILENKEDGIVLAELETWQTKWNESDITI